MYLSSKERYTIVMMIIPVFLWLNVLWNIVCKVEMGLTVPVTIFLTLTAIGFWIITV